MSDPAHGAGSVPIFDNHVHLRADGDGVAAAARYEAAGGTHLMLVHSPHADMDDEGRPKWHEAYQATVDMASKVRAETNLGVWVALGPYPVHLVHLAKRFGATDAKAMLLEGLELAADFVREGDAVAIGEVGRPHFPVEDDVWVLANETLREILHGAQQLGVPAILHTESATPQVMAELAGIADKAGLPRERTIKHYSAPLVLPEEHHGLVPSVIASRKHIRRAAQMSPEGRFLLETDYIDDHDRPNVVMPVDTVPKRVKGFLASGELTADQVHRMNVELVEDLYGVETGF